MSFITDRQTLDDLNLPGKFRHQSIFSLFNRVQTRGAERLLETMFLHPLQDKEEINRRSAIFRFFHQQKIDFPLDPAVLQLAEEYLGLSSSGPNGWIGHHFVVLKKKMMAVLFQDEQYGRLREGFTAAIDVLARFRDFVTGFLEKYPSGPCTELLDGIRMQFEPMAALLEVKEYSLVQFLAVDHHLRHRLQSVSASLLQAIYQLDVYCQVGAVAREKGFGYAHALSREDNRLQVTDFRYPWLDKGIGNSLTLSAEANLLFLTGANMAGKSTLMKSFGICFYLAHMGFPVPAAAMEFSIRDGLYTSINVSDNLELGYSHFYAEVLRVKKVAEEVSSGKDLLVIFDELFKGTNVKDAYDATLAVTSAFLGYRNCLFIISTHIIEVGEALQAKGIRFGYMPTVMEGHIPRYSYRMEDGITADRHGMLIIRNEGIREIILSGNKPAI